MHRQRGFTFLWLIFALAVVATALAAIAQPVSLAVRRDREAELMFRGQEIANALARYWAATPGGAKQLPNSLEELLDDRRGSRPLHHLRRLYVDPFTGLPDWVLVTTEEGRISGIHSRSDALALRVVDMPAMSDGTPRPVSMRVFSFTPILPASAASAVEAVRSSPQRNGSPTTPSP